jgi:tyrosyl-tRNA synthetase
MPAAPKFQSSFLASIAARGAYFDSTEPEALDALFGKEPVAAYIGFDCTGPSLHVGSLVQIMTLRRLQQAGHKPIVLMGGGTTKVGDPSGKDETRQILTPERIEANKQSILKSFERFLTFGDGPSDAVMVDNAEWLDKLDYIPFLRDIGRHFSINRMLTMDSVKLRLERDQPLSFLEFNYMILQSYDFVELYRRYGCRLQCGGSDQWGNIVSGIDLGRRVAEAQLFGLTSPLIATASGAKMGKTAAGAVWLNADMCSPYDYWQYWRNAEDADVGRFLRLFTDLPEAEVARLESLQGAELNDAKKILATECTALAHGREAADAAAETARRTFEDGAAAEGLPIKLLDWSADEKSGEHDWTFRSAEAILKASELATSLSDARRKIEAGAVRINDRLINDPKEQFRATDIDPEVGAFKVQYGKKKIVLVKPT